MELKDALRINPTLEITAVEAYGCEMAPLVNYANHSKKIASEYVLKVGGKKRRVYSWLTEYGTDAMYVLKDSIETFLSAEVTAMLHYGEPHYGGMTPVAQAVKVAA